jgi:ABC-type transport system involved in multi-copper enzyme maturation permease subunit
MKHLLQSELYRLKKNKGIFILLIVAIILAILEPIVLKKGLETLSSLVGLGGTIDIYGIDQFCTALSGSSLISFILFFIITSYSNDDFKYGTVRNKIISGYNRKQIYLSKLIVNVSASVAVQLVYSLSVLLFSSLVLGFNKSSSFELSDFTNILSLILSSVLIQVTTYSLLTLINVTTQKNAKTIIWFLATNMIISFALSIIMIILSELDLQSWITLIQDMDPNNQLTYISKNYLETDLFILIIVSNIIYIVIINLIGYNNFKKKELK